MQLAGDPHPLGGDPAPTLLLAFAFELTGAGEPGGAQIAPRPHDLADPDRAEDDQQAKRLLGELVTGGEHRDDHPEEDRRGQGERDHDRVEAIALGPDRRALGISAAKQRAASRASAGLGIGSLTDRR